MILLKMTFVLLDQPLQSTIQLDLFSVLRCPFSLIPQLFLQTIVLALKHKCIVLLQLDFCRPLFACNCNFHEQKLSKIPRIYGHLFHQFQRPLRVLRCKVGLKHRRHVLQHLRKDILTSVPHRDVNKEHAELRAGTCVIVHIVQYLEIQRSMPSLIQSATEDLHDLILQCGNLMYLVSGYQSLLRASHMLQKGFSPRTWNLSASSHNLHNPIHSLSAGMVKQLAYSHERKPQKISASMSSSAMPFDPP